MRWAEWKYRILFGALMLLVVLQPLISGQSLAKRLLDVLLLLVLIAAVSAVSRSGRRAVLAFGLALPSVLAISSKYVAGEAVLLEIAAHLSVAAFLVFVGWSLMAEVLEAPSISSDKLFAALCVYLLLGVIWSFIYAALELSTVQAAGTAHFSVAAETADRQEGRPLSLFVYYSFVTLTTLGYGDITPISPVARTLAWLEAFIGQLYVAVLIARLVGLHIAGKMGEEDPGAND